MSDMSRNIEGKEAEEILDSILADYELDRTIDKMEDFYDQPNKEVIIDIIEKLLKIIYPGYYRDRAYKSYHANHHLSTLIEDVCIVSADRLQKFQNSVRSWMENAGNRLKKKATRSQ